MRTREPVTISLTADDTRAVATMTLPGMGAGATVTRGGRDEREALSATLRALADLVDSRQRAARREADTTWVRVSLDVDIEVSEAEVQRAEDLEEVAMTGDKAAGNELLDLSLAWIASALHDEDARDWQSFSWSRREECDDFNLA
jgi:hypothetical protein